MQKRRCFRGKADHAREALDALCEASLAYWDEEKRVVTLDPETIKRLRAEGWKGGNKEGGVVTGAGAGAGGTGEHSHPTAPPAAGEIFGLGKLPRSWPELPLKASLAAEMTWVQGNRLDVVESRPNGSAIVHLERASEPAPSKSALAWLETSIRNYGKYTDLVARVLKDELDAEDEHRRERIALEEIDDLIMQMMREY